MAISFRQLLKKNEMNNTLNKIDIDEKVSYLNPDVSLK
jgi:hypothetical protein